MTYKDLIEWFENAEGWTCGLSDHNDIISYEHYQEDAIDLQFLILKNAHNLMFLNYLSDVRYTYYFEQVDANLGFLSLDNDIFIFNNGSYEYNQI